MSKDTDPRRPSKRALTRAKEGSGQGKKGRARLEEAKKRDPWAAENRPEWCKLSAKGRVFVDEYSVDLSVVRAAERSGLTYYSARTLICTDYRAAVHETLALRAKEAGIGATEVLRDLRIVADKCMGRIPISKSVTGKDGKLLSHHEEFDWDPGGANTALLNLGRHQKLFTDVVENRSHEQALDELWAASERLGYKVKVIGGLPVMLEPGKALVLPKKKRAA